MKPKVFWLFKKMSTILCILKVHDHSDKIRPLVPILSHTQPLQFIPSSPFKIYLILFHQRVGLRGFPIKILCTFLFSPIVPHAYHVLSYLVLSSDYYLFGKDYKLFKVLIV